MKLRLRAMLGGLASALALSLSACGHELRNDPSGPEIAGSITVTGWSQATQVPIPVKGVLRGEGDEKIGDFDTKSDPASGKVFDHLAPGTYRVEISQRYGPSGALLNASGSRRVDLQPGERVPVEVVAIDEVEQTPPH